MLFNLLEQWEIHVTAALVLKALHSAHELIVCYMYVVEQAQVTSPRATNSLVFVMDKKCVLSEGKLTF
jgi:hypothetical protein